MQHMSEIISPQPQEHNIEDYSKKKRVENLLKLFDEAEAIFATEGRESAKPYLPRIYDDLILLNKRNK